MKFFRMMAIYLAVSLLPGLKASGVYFQDRVLIYLDNSVNGIQLRKTGGVMRSDLPEFNSLMDEIGVIHIRPWLPSASPLDRDGDVYLNRFYIVEVADGQQDLDLICSNLESSNLVTQAEPLPVVRPLYTPNDPHLDQQWFLPAINAPKAWELWDIDGGEIPGSNDQQEMTVAVVDDGTQWTHPDLVENIWNNLGEDANGNGKTIIMTNGNWVLDPGDLNEIDDDGNGYTDDLIGWDVASNSSGDHDNDPDPASGDSHGTMVAGSVSATTNNGIGIASVGWSVKIMPIKASYENNDYIDFAYDGLLAAGKMGADIINCSWGGFGFSNGAQHVVNVVYNDYKAIIVAAAGNGNDSTGVTNFDTHYPSGYDNVISVSATGPDDRFGASWFHPTAGPTIDLCAPGENIHTTFINGNYNNVFGTSFAAPITAGAMALVWSWFPGKSRSWIKDRIISTTDPFPDMMASVSVQNIDEPSAHVESLEGMLGSGRLNVFRALAAGTVPDLTITDFNYSDDDGDGLFNPGESIRLMLEVSNGAGFATATELSMTLTTSDPRITITDNALVLTDPIPEDSAAISESDWFELNAGPEAKPGRIILTVTFESGPDSNRFESQTDLVLHLTLNQVGFPFLTDNPVRSSPLVYDLDSDGLNEIYFGTDGLKLYGLDGNGSILPGFPHMVGNQIRSCVAIGDLEGAGSHSLVFGTKDGRIYRVNDTGAIHQIYQAGGAIMDAVVLADMDHDRDLEIIFGTFEGTEGKVYAIHHDGTDVTGFPLDLGEIINVAPAVGDLDRDGSMEIVVGTWSNKIHVVNSDGSLRSGFPFQTGNRVNSPPAVADLDGDGDLEIAVGCDDGKVYLLHHDGSLLKRIEGTFMVRGGPTFHDSNGDGRPEIYFGGHDQKIHALDTSTWQELIGWPVDVGQAMTTAPVFADLDSDGMAEIICATKKGKILVFHADGIPMPPFPVTVNGEIRSSLAVQDLDRDGDLEILVPTTNGLEIMDVKTLSGSVRSWSIYRGGYHRRGAYEEALLSNGSFPDPIIPVTLSLHQNYPNPFNPVTSIPYDLPENRHVTLTIYDILGQEVAVLLDGFQAAGFHTAEWNPGRSASGIYFVQMISGEYRQVRKMMVIQ